jgi:hypothetical protein
MMAYQELVKLASLYINAYTDVHMDQSVIMLLDACRLPSVVVCCGDSGVGATVLFAAVQVLLIYLLFLLLLTWLPSFWLLSLASLAPALFYLPFTCHCERDVRRFYSSGIAAGSNNRSCIS